MNKQRRNRIEYVKAKLGELKYEIENLHRRIKVRNRKFT